MSIKLTLTIEKTVIEKAKDYAKKSGRSLSDLIESYLQRLITDSEVIEQTIPEEFKDLFTTPNIVGHLRVSWGIFIYLNRFFVPLYCQFEE